MEDDDWGMNDALASAPRATPARASSGGGVSKSDEMQMKDARDAARAADSALRIYDNVGRVVDRYKPGPDRAARIDSATPYKDDGFFGSLYARTIGKIDRSFLIPEQDQEDHAYLKAQQAERTAERQKEQKGVQTEADAVRYALADVGPDKDLKVNRRIIQDGKVRLSIMRRLPLAQELWVNRYGSLSKASPNGQTFSDYWNREQRNVVESFGAKRYANSDTYDASRTATLQRAKAKAGVGAPRTTNTTGWSVQR